MISKMLAILEPTALATGNSLSPEKTEKIEETNSGSEVETATIVAPTINGDIPIFKPIFSDDSKSQSEPLISNNKDKIKTPDQNAIIILGYYNIIKNHLLLFSTFNKEKPLLLRSGFSEISFY